MECIDTNQRRSDFLFLEQKSDYFVEYVHFLNTCVKDNLCINNISTTKYNLVDMSNVYKNEIVLKFILHPQFKF